MKHTKKPLGNFIFKDLFLKFVNPVPRPEAIAKAEKIKAQG
jgi:hypothetical protein